jgi:hypothetical protein
VLKAWGKHGESVLIADWHRSEGMLEGLGLLAEDGWHDPEKVEGFCWRRRIKEGIAGREPEQPGGR